MATERVEPRDALFERARDAARTAEEERRRLDSLATRLRAMSDLYAKMRAALDPASKQTRILLSNGSRDESTAIPDHLTIRVLGAIADIISGEVAEILSELERSP